MNRIFSFIICLSANIALAQTLGANLIDNGDFEKGNYSFSSQLTYITCREGKNACGNGKYMCSGTYTIAKTPLPCNPDWGAGLKDHSSKRGNMLIADYDQNRQMRLWTQKVKVKPNKTYIFRTWVANLSPFAEPAAIQLIGGTQKSAVITLGDNANWDIFSLVIKTGSETELLLAIDAANTGVIGYDIALDDITLQEVTMPSTLKSQDLPTQITPKLPPKSPKTPKKATIKDIPTPKTIVKKDKKEPKIQITDTTTRIVTRNIAWDRREAVLRAESFAVLDEVCAELKRHSTCQLQVVSHTDTRGSAEPNLQLSLRRSQVVVEYLIKKGIDADRLTYKGMGESAPLVNCPTDEACDESQHAVNRRTEFMITRK